LLPVLLSVCGYALFLFARLTSLEWNPFLFIYAGEQFCNPKEIPKGVIIIKDTGYDGQFYYRLALDPFSSEKTQFGITIDVPAYRQQRILYPLIVWLLSLEGNPALVPPTMILVNLIGLCWISYLGSLLAREYGLHSIWGCVFSFYPGFLLTLSRNLTEIVAAVLLVAFLLALKKQKLILAMILLSFSVFTRETILVVVVALGVEWLWNRIRKPNHQRIKWFVFGIPLICYWFWQWFLSARWGYYSGNALLHYQFGYPLGGIVRFLTSAYKNVPDSLFFLLSLEGILIVTLLGIVLYLIIARDSKNMLSEKIAWLGYAFFAFLTYSIWIEELGFMRQLFEYYTLGSLIVLSGSKQKMKGILAGLWLILWMGVAMYHFGNVVIAI